MQRPSYAQAVKWIAGNDDSASMDLDKIVKYVTVALVADLFGKHVEEVGADVQDERGEQFEGRAARTQRVREFRTAARR